MGNPKKLFGDWHEREKKKIRNRLDAVRCDPAPRGKGPEFGTTKIHYEVSSRTHAITCGGIGAIHQLAHKSGLVNAIDTQLQILKRYHPYRDSDHILNIAYNVIAGGTVVDDIEVRRNDAAYLDAIDTRAIPDPTTAGDFLCRFDSASVMRLMNTINDVRMSIWRQQPKSFFEETARIDVDSTIVPTGGECKQGMGIAYDGQWGHHPLVVTLAKTKEPLYIVNRRGNRPSSEGAPEYLNLSIALCRRAGWKDILLRGDTAFALTKYFDDWDNQDVRFVFGYSASKKVAAEADVFEDSDYKVTRARARARTSW